MTRIRPVAHASRSPGLLLPSLMTALLTLLLALLALLAPRPARAQLEQPGNVDAKIMVHIVPVAQAGGRPCTGSKALARCDEMKVSGSVGEYYYAFVCVTDCDPDSGVAGAQFGVKYNRANHLGVDVYSWNLCATLEFAQRSWWENSNRGTLITWDPSNNCQRFEPSGSRTGVTAVLGYFYLYAETPDRFEIVPRPEDGIAKVADCQSKETYVAGTGAPFHTKSYLGYVEFSQGATTLGSNPCGLAKPVVKATWSEVKKNGGGQ